MKNSNGIRRGILFFLIIIGIGQAYAQKVLGLQLSANSTNIRYITNYTEQKKTSAIGGYSIGAFYKYTISSGFSIRPSLSFMWSGFRLDDATITSNRMLTKVTSSNVQLAVAARIMMGDKAMKPYFEIGPAMSKNTNQRARNFGTVTQNEFDMETIKSSDTKVVASVGFQTELFRTQVDIFLGYEMGVGNLYVGSDPSATIRTKAFTFGITAGLWRSQKRNKTYCTKRKCI